MTKLTKRDPWGYTHDSYKAFKNALENVLIDSPVDDLKNYRLSAQKLVMELIQERNPHILNRLINNDIIHENSQKNRALLDRTLTETNIIELKADDDRQLTAAKIKSTELDIQLKEKELNGVSAEDIPSSGMESPALAQLLQFAEAQTRKKKKS